MPPKKKTKLFDKRSGIVDGVKFTLYEDGVLLVGTEAGKRLTRRLKSGADVDGAIVNAVRELGEKAGVSGAQLCHLLHSWITHAHSTHAHTSSGKDP